MKRILSLGLIVLAAMLLVGCSGKGFVDPLKRDYIVVGLEADYVPFNWYEETATEHNVPLVGGGFVDGYDVQIAKLIAEELGKDLRIKAIGWRSLVPELLAGDIDLIIAGMSPTEERKETIDFTSPYYSSDHILVVNRNGSFANITSLEELAGARGVGQTATIYDDLVVHVVEEYGAVHNTARDKTSLMVLDILNDDADFMIVETPVALLYANKFEGLSLLFQGEGNIFNVADEDRDVSIGVRKGEAEFLRLLNEALEGITLETREQIMESVSLRAELDDE